jgi:hypothetical protein
MTVEGFEARAMAGQMRGNGASMAKFFSSRNPKKPSRPGCLRTLILFPHPVGGKAAAASKTRNGGLALISTLARAVMGCSKGGGKVQPWKGKGKGKGK